MRLRRPVSVRSFRTGVEAFRHALRPSWQSLYRSDTASRPDQVGGGEKPGGMEGGGGGGGNLRVKTFVGTSRNPLHIQIWTALIAPQGTNGARSPR